MLPSLHVQCSPPPPGPRPLVPTSPVPIPSRRTGAADTSPGLRVAQGQGLGLLSLCTVSAQHRLGTEHVPDENWLRGAVGYGSHS